MSTYFAITKIRGKHYVQVGIKLTDVYVLKVRHCDRTDVLNVEANTTFRKIVEADKNERKALVDVNWIFDFLLYYNFRYRKLIIQIIFSF